MHKALRTWHEDNHKELPIVLQPPKAKIIKDGIPLQEDVWSCGIHVLMAALATIYNGKKPILQYTREHAYLLSRSHLHFEFTGEVLPCDTDIVDILRLTIPQASSIPSLQPANDRGYKATCVDQAIDKAHAERPALGITVCPFLLSMIELFTNNIFLLQYHV